MNYISYRWQLKKRHLSREKTVATYKRLQKQAEQAQKSREDIDSLISEAMFELDMVDDEIETLESRYLIESARRMVLPIPEFEQTGEFWKESLVSGRYRLTKQAMMNLRGLVRKERRELDVGWIAP